MVSIHIHSKRIGTKLITLQNLARKEKIGTKLIALRNSSCRFLLAATSLVYCPNRWSKYKDCLVLVLILDTRYTRTVHTNWAMSWAHIGYKYIVVYDSGVSASSSCCYSLPFCLLLPPPEVWC